MADVELGTGRARGSSDTTKEGTFAVTAGATQIVYLQGVQPPISVTALPGGGGTANVHTTTTPLATVKSGSGIEWIEWASGAVSADTSDVLLGPVSAIRFTATTANADFEIQQ